MFWVRLVILMWIGLVSCIIKTSLHVTYDALIYVKVYYLYILPCYKVSLPIIERDDTF